MTNSTDALAPALAVCSDYSFHGHSSVFKRVVVAENQIFDLPQMLPAPKIEYAGSYKPHPKLRKRIQNP